MKNFFELKNLLITGLLFLEVISCHAFSVGNFQEGVELYRKNNPKECLEIMNSIIKKEPKNPYIIYYQAMASTKLGKLDDAKNFYREVIKINTDNKLVEFSKEGIENIEKAQGIKPSTKQTTKDQKNDKASQKIVSKVKKEEKNEVSDEEVLKAIKTLREAGLLNVNLQTGTKVPENITDQNSLKMNNDMMQMNMLMTGFAGGKSNDMLPMLMMMQGQNGKNISPELLQMMMNNSMLDGLSTFDTKDK